MEEGYAGSETCAFRNKEVFLTIRTGNNFFLQLKGDCLFMKRVIFFKAGDRTRIFKQ